MEFRANDNEGLSLWVDGKWVLVEYSFIIFLLIKNLDIGISLVNVF